MNKVPFHTEYSVLLRVVGDKSLTLHRLLDFLETLASQAPGVTVLLVTYLLLGQNS